MGTVSDEAPAQEERQEKEIQDRGAFRVRFHVDGPPTSKDRPRAVIIRGHVRLYTTSKTEKYERRVGQLAKIAMAGAQPTRAPVSVHLRVTFRIAESWPKWRKAAALAGKILPTHQEDLDNIAKAVLDGINKVVYADDGQVCELAVSCEYGSEPGIACLVEEIGGKHRHDASRGLVS